MSLECGVNLTVPCGNKPCCGFARRQAQFLGDQLVVEAAEILVNTIAGLLDAGVGGNEGDANLRALHVEIEEDGR